VHIFNYQAANITSMSEYLHNIQFSFQPYVLQFKFEAGTSRGVMTEKTSYLLQAIEKEKPIVIGWGEAGPLPKLSVDDMPDFVSIMASYVEKLSGSAIPADPNSVLDWCSSQIPENLPSIRFAFETALLDLAQGGERKIFDTAFFQGKMAIPINGLIWMGKKEMMMGQIEKKLSEGYSCIKMKIGAIGFSEELDLIAHIRSRFGADNIVLRVDANGAFSPEEASEKLRKLAEWDIHSIEQPIRPGQVDAMASLCLSGILPIALDEELIGVTGREEKLRLLERIKPQYIILKPTLHGGIRACQEWIQLAEDFGIGWWMTSALESNIGLNAVAQFTSTYPINIPQGLGTGQLYHNNFNSPLTIAEGYLHYLPNPTLWDLRV
jgi:o-succinylbenzoate synthase